jgi:hypothetical protein
VPEARLIAAERAIVAGKIKAPAYLREVPAQHARETAAHK